VAGRMTDMMIKKKKEKRIGRVMGFRIGWYDEEFKRALKTLS
jgi:hypothetical protein